ncbi:MAG: PTS sugar transporter subunit IIA [candidate division WOR-3 bacterium]
MISLSSFIKPGLAFDLESAGSQQELFRAVADRLIEYGLGNDREALVEAFTAREAICSTGVGHGVAIPHASTEAAADIAVTVVRLHAPLEWHARDHQPVNLVVAICSPPTMRDRYLQVLSALARALHVCNVRSLVLGASSPAEAAGIIAGCAEESGEPEEKQPSSNSRPS